MKRSYIFIISLIALSIAAIVAQSLMAGPAKADYQLVNRIQDVQADIDTYTTREGQLPASIRELSGGPYSGVTYTKINATTFKLCATFQTATKDRRSEAGDSLPSYIDAASHGRGYQCFSRTAEAAADSPAGRPSRR